MSDIKGEILSYAKKLRWDHEPSTWKEIAEEQQKQIDKLNKVLSDYRSKSISIAAWVARETHGDDYTEKMQNRFYNNVIKKIKALVELKR